MMSSSVPRKKVFISQHIPKAAVDIVSRECDVDYNDSDTVLSKSELIKRSFDADGVLCILENKIDTSVLSEWKNVKVVSTMSVGVDHIDVKECKKRNIKVGNTPGVLTDTTADLTLALILATCRRIPEAVDAVKSGEWSSWRPEWMCGRDLSGCTVGIVGLGRIGAAVAKRLKGFDCKIIYTGSTPKAEAVSLGASFVSMDEVLSVSDIVTLHCPLTPATKNLINAHTLGKMRKEAILINTTRGNVVDQDAVYEALTQGKIAAAGLDVTTPEPLPPSHPLLTLKNCVILPHIGSASIATRTKMATMAAQNVIAGVKGEKLPFEYDVK